MSEFLICRLSEYPTLGKEKLMGVRICNRSNKLGLLPLDRFIHSRRPFCLRQFVPRREKSSLCERDRGLIASERA